jgi:twitching motility protein PilT
MSEVNIAGIEPWVNELWDRGGSDLLISAGSPPMIRVDGQMTPVTGGTPLDAATTEQLVHDLLPGDMREEYEERKEIDFSFSWGETSRFRGNAFTQRGTAALALRAIPFYIPSFAELGLPPTLEWFCAQAQGLVLFTGPTGSGKSTTQASMVDWINTHRRLHVLSLEEPIEYVHMHKSSVVNQREVGVDTDSFARGLRSALREDPDVVLVGEMRDLDSIQTTLTIAETGHLVLATLHTNDTASAIDRIVDVFPADRQAQIRTQLAAAIAGVVAQRLVPRIGGGLVAAFEVMVATNPVRALIREGKSHQLRNVVSQGAADGMQTLEASLSHLVHSGVVTYEDATVRALVPKEIRPPVSSGHAPQAYAGAGLLDT